MIDKTDPTNRDTVPAMLTPGEFVLNKEASTMFAPVIEQMNNAGLQHRAMKNMGGGIQNYNDGSAGGVKASPYTYEDKIAFIKEITPHANRVGAKLGIDPKLIIAQAIQETGWGEKVKGNNFFGIKSHGKEGGQTITTHENIDGKKVKVKDSFRKYDNMGQSVEDYGNFLLNNPRYKGVLEADGLDAQIEAMGNSGYATDPNYGNALSNIVAGKTFVNNYTSTPVAEVPQPTTQTASSEPGPRFFSGGGADGVGNFGIIGDFFGGVTTPPVENVSSIPPKTIPNTQANPITVEQAIMQASVPQVQAAPPAPTDFGEAFKDARADMGAGGIFTFRGRDYTTNYAEEEDKTMTANMGGSVYLNMGGYPQEYLDNYRKAIMANMGPEYLARIERIVSKDAARELQAQVRPDYTPGNIKEDSASSEPMAYNDPALKARSDGEIDLRLSDRMLDKNLYLSQPGTGMTTEKSMAKRKNLASNSYVPMPEVNSDESLLQGSSGSVASAARSFPSDYPINMDVPRVEGYNIPAPTPAPRPTMLDGQLYYLNGDGLVTDSNGNPVQDPEIGSAVQDKLNYSPEESAANAQAYNESIAQQNVFNGTTPQSVNPSYDSMRQQQESNAAEAERIRAEIAQIDMKRQALNDGFNNREPIVVPLLERGPPLLVEGFVPDVPAYEGELGGLMPPYEGELGGGNIPNLNPAANLDVGHPDRVAAIKAGTLEPTDADYAFDEEQYRLSEALRQNRIDQAVADEYGKTVGGDGSLKSEEQRLAAQLSGVPFIDYPPIESADIASSLPPELTEDAVIASGLPQAKTNPTVILQAANKIQTAEDAIEKAKRDLATAETGIRNASSAEQVARYEEMGKKAKTDLTTSSADLAKAQETQSNIDEVDAAAEADKATLTETTKAQADAAREAALSSLGFSTGPEKKGPGATKGPMIKTGPNGTILDANGKPIVNLTPQQAITSDAAAKAKAEADKIAAAGGGKNTPEVSGAMSMLKSVFGDLFDSKELIRAAIMYLGGRATGMDGNQALAFAGKNYIARTDAKVGAYQKVALEGKHTKDSLAVYKKTMNPADLVAKGLPAVPTGDFKTMYDRKTGREITLTEKKVGDGSYWFDGNKRVDLRTLTNDGRFAPKTAANITYKNTIRGNVESLVTSLDALNPSKNKDAKAGISELGIAKETIGREAVTFAIENGMELEQMEELVEKAYKEALVDARSGKKISRLSDYFSRAWVESNTTDAQNFFLPGETKDGKPIPVPVANVTTFLQTIKNAAAASGKQELANMSDTQVSSWLMSTESYKAWQTMDPELKKEYIKTGAASGRSGMMEYILSGMVS